MNIFRKIFDNFSFSAQAPKEEEKSQFMPEPYVPLDEQFISEFVNNGGKFLYCADMTEVRLEFENILEENDWHEKEVFCLEPKLYNILNENKLIYNNVKSPEFLFVGCESLIAEEGSIMFSSKQIGQKKIHQLPQNIIVFATINQIVRSKSDGLRGIRSRYITKFPTNITTLKYFKPVKSDDFLHYGSVPKNMYLILLENI